MYIYRLRHINDNADYDLPEPLTLGYFSDLSKTKEAIEYYRTLLGFQDYPNGSGESRRWLVRVLP